MRAHAFRGAASPRATPPRDEVLKRLLDFSSFGAMVRFVAKLTAEDRGAFYFFRWEGVLTEKEILSVASEYYPKLGGRNKLFDMTRADLTDFNLDNMVTVARGVSEVHPEGGSPKTAFVAADFSTYSIITRYVLLAFQNHVRVEYRVFGDIEQALEWLDAD